MDKLDYIKQRIKLPNLTKAEMAEFYHTILGVSLQELDTLDYDTLIGVYKTLYQHSAEHPYITLLYVLYKCKSPRYRNQISRQEMEIYNLYKKLEMY